MEGLIGYIATVIASLTAGYLLTYLQPKSKLYFWAPHTFFFDIKDKNILLLTNAITIQNLGRKAASNVEIIFNKKPDFYDFSPKINYSEKAQADFFIITLQNLGPKEFTTLQMLSYETHAPVLQNIRSDGGQAKNLNFQIARVFPKWVNLGFWLVILAGLGFITFWCVNAVVFISQNIL